MIKTYDVILELCKEIHPTSSYEMHGDLANITDLSILTLDGGSTTLSFTFDDVEKKQISMQAEYDSQEYARKRAQEYPDLAEQLDLLWHAIDTDTLDNKDSQNKFYTMLKKVKEDNPKG